MTTTAWNRDNIERKDTLRPVWKHVNEPYRILVGRRDARPVGLGVIYRAELQIDLARTDRFRDEHEARLDAARPMAELADDYSGPDPDKPEYKDLRLLDWGDDEEKVIATVEDWVDEHETPEEIEPTLWRDVDEGDRLRIETTEGEITGGTVDGVAEAPNGKDFEIYEVLIEKPDSDGDLAVEVGMLLTNAKGNVKETPPLDEYRQHLRDADDHYDIPTESLGSVLSMEITQSR